MLIALTLVKLIGGRGSDLRILSFFYVQSMVFLFVNAIHRSFFKLGIYRVNIFPMLGSVLHTEFGKIVGDTLRE